MTKVPATIATTAIGEDDKVDAPYPVWCTPVVGVVDGDTVKN